MKIDVVKDLNDKEFYRLTGVQRNTFFKMVEILEKANIVKRELGGRPSKLSIPDQILATLEYLREYRTYFHIGVAYGISVLMSIEKPATILIEKPAISYNKIHLCNF